MIGHTPDLKLRELFLNGAPVTCPAPACGLGGSLTLTRTRPDFETWPARLDCLTCGQGEDHPVITNGLCQAALAARTGRTKATDRDTFTAEWRGLVLDGECTPQFTVDDARTAVAALADAGNKEIRTRRRAWWKNTKKTATGQAEKASATLKTRIRDTARQASGAGPAQPKPRRRRCRVKGCRAGWLTITTRVHSTTGHTEKVKVPCSACHRA